MSTNNKSSPFLTTGKLKEAENTPLALLQQNSLESLANLSLMLAREIEALKAAQTNFGFKDKNQKVSFEKVVKNFEIGLIRNALIQSNGNQLRAAELLELKPTTLNAKIKRYGIKSGL